MSEVIGPKLTKINPKTNKPYYYKDNPEAVKARDSKRMYVNGKEVSKKHPLYKPGKYKGFTDAAFSSLQNYAEAKEGQVYIICNPSFRNWCKVGMAVDAEDRLKQYQTSSPHRDYELVKCYNTSNRRETETKAHAELEKHYKRKGEWFMCTGYNAQKILDAMLETEGEQLGLF
jgi:hypothetical protein